MAPLTFEARFDGEVFRPVGPVSLPSGVVYTISIRGPLAIEPRVVDQPIAAPVDPKVPPAETAWEVLDRMVGTYDGPTDWSAEHDHYLYGTPKRGDQEET